MDTLQVSHGVGERSPVVEVHDGLDGAAASGGDVTLEARQQRRHHVHSVLFTLPEGILKNHTLMSSQQTRETVTEVLGSKDTRIY